MSTNNNWNNQIGAANRTIILNSGTNGVNISSDAFNTTVNLGTGVGNKTVNLGSPVGTSTTSVEWGSGGLQFPLVNEGALITSVTGGVSTITGTAGYVLTANAPGTAPSFQAAPAGGITTLDGNSGSATGATVTVEAATTDGTAKTVGSGSTLTLNFSDGNNNVGIGLNTLGALTSGTNNLCLGYQAGNALTSGSDNMALGYRALYLGTNATFNVCVGFGALGQNTSGTLNVGIGANAGANYTTTETDNICIGTNTMGTIGENHTCHIADSGTITATFIGGIAGVNVGSVATVVTESGNQLGTATITAGTNISVTPGANTITIATTGAASMTWSVITANQTAAVNNGYFCNKAGTLALALPAASSVGDVIQVANENTATGIQFTQAAGQQILIGNTNTTSGAAGTLTSSAVGDSLRLVCKTANTIWRVVDIVGNWTPA